MWTIEQIYAKDFSAFRELNYTLNQKHTTLIFGNNMDNDSQKSNGSGKSALIEAIAVGLTGSTLRNIKTEEIINDNAEEATVGLLLHNDFTGEYFSINRKLSRKSPQEIELAINRDVNEVGEPIWEPISQASVNDYNKYVLDMIGLTKDDIYANYILCKHKYQSFLSSSDKEKKEIINRFSNGILVDESIAALEADMEPVVKELEEADRNVANCTGRVEAIGAQIDEAVSESADRCKDRADRIQSWKDAIANKRGAIRSSEEEKSAIVDKIPVFHAMIEKLNDAEEKDNSVEEAYGEIMGILVPNELTIEVDYDAELARLTEELDNLKRLSTEKLEASENAQKQAEKLAKIYNSLSLEYLEFKNEYDIELPKVNDTINKLLKDIRDCEEENKRNQKLRIDLNNQIALLNKRLAGVIVCPKCKYEFTLDNDVDIEATKRTLRKARADAEENEKYIESAQKLIDEYTQNGRKARASQTEWGNRLAEWSDKLNEAKVAVNRASRNVDDSNSECITIQNKIAKVESDIANVRTKVFDEAFRVVENSLDDFNTRIESLDRAISNAKGAIQSYEESIREIENTSDTNMIESLRTTKIKYQNDLDNAVGIKGNVEAKLNEFKTQEAIFTEFKTHLANSKIEALSHITNEFLEAIGSDIRIAFSGFTVLKSGKVRDKISISLLRDGINCGSFDKFSEGEKARVNLANILAMHKLTNVSCPEGKGLDLLILDEILDATDETGLANIFSSLNDFKITSLVVSHGNIAENYPYKLVVTKQNGISSIND